MVLERIMVSDMRGIPGGSLFVFAERAVGALTRRRLGDGHQRVADGGSGGALIMGQAVTQEIGVVTLVEAVQTLVRAAGFGARQTRMRHRLGNLELEAEFDRRDPVGVPGA